MAEKEVALILNVNGAKAIKTVGELKKGIADTRKELENTEIGSKRFDELSEAVKQAEGRLSELNAQSTFLRDMPGPIGMVAKGFHDMKTAVLTGVKALGTLRGAIAATGIGLLLTAFASLQAYFTRTEEGAQKLRVVMGFLGAAVDKVADVFVGIGESMVNAFENPQDALQSLADAIRDNISNRIEGLIELFPKLGEAINLALSGEFSAAGKVATDALAKTTLGVEDFTDKVGDATKRVVDFAKEVGETAVAGAELEDALNKVLVKERELRVERAEANATIAEQRNLAKDLNLSLEERIAALTMANEMEQELLVRELENERERLRIMEEKAALAKSDEDTLNAIADQQVRVANIEEQSLNKRRELQEQLTTLRRQEEAEAKAAAEAKEQEEKERSERDAELRRQLRDAEIANIEDERQQELERAEEDFQRKLEQIEGESEIETQLRAELEERKRQTLQDINAKYDKAEVENKKKLDAEILKSEQEVANARISAATSVAGALGQIAQAIEGESKAAVAARKVLALAEIGINLAVSIATAVAGATQAAAAGGPAAPFLQVAYIATMIGSVVAGIAGAYKALSSAGGPSVSTPSVSAPSAPTVNPVTTNTTELGNTDQANLAPIQAYVVETELTGTQQNVNQIESQATFGG